jgi:endonuclease/exonuclease/phosphatase (EEP) superfamily protein YafD
MLGLIGVFRHREKGTRVLVASTHLWWNPSHEDIKLSQTQHLIDRMATHHTEHAILAGDFNSLPKSNVVSYVTGKPPTFDKTNQFYSPLTRESI